LQPTASARLHAQTIALTGEVTYLTHEEAQKLERGPSAMTRLAVVEARRRWGSERCAIRLG